MRGTRTGVLSILRKKWEGCGGSCQVVKTGEVGFRVGRGTCCTIYKKIWKSPRKSQEAYETDKKKITGRGG